MKNLMETNKEIDNAMMAPFVKGVPNLGAADLDRIWLFSVFGRDWPDSVLTKMFDLTFSERDLVLLVVGKAVRCAVRQDASRRHDPGDRDLDGTDEESAESEENLAERFFDSGDDC
jgi:hypothetical protein